MRVAFVLLIGAAFVLAAHGAERAPVCPDDPKGLKLPPAMPRMVDGDGNVVWIDRQLSSQEYRYAAITAVLQEANRLAKDLELAEDLPITRTNLVQAAISPFGFNYAMQCIGTISTRNYHYGVSRGCKFSDLTVANYDQTCLWLRQHVLPVRFISTNEACELTTQWMARACMDVKALNRECKCHVALSPHWNRVGKLGETPREVFTPIYFVWWTSPVNDAGGFGSVAYAEVYTPTKMLLQLAVHDPKFILSEPVVIPDLDSLFQGSGAILPLPPAANTNSTPDE